MSELDDLRYNTAIYIAQEPQAVTLMPHTKSRGPGGGYEAAADTAREAQAFRIIRQSTIANSLPTEAGNIKNWDYLLIGFYDAEVETGDTWQYDGSSYRIAAVARKNYETLAIATAFGKEPSYG